MLSKSTINKILAGISDMMKNTIVNEIGNQQYSVQMDSSQDVAVIDQESIILRYVDKEDVKERLFAVQKVESSSGSELYAGLKKTLERHNLKIEKIASESFDGAANMRRQYEGFQSYIKETPPMQFTFGVTRTF